jgi:predicted membrane protein
MVVVLVIAILSAIPASLIFRKQGGVRRGIAAYGACFLLGVVLSILWAEAMEATAFNINSGMGVVGAFLGPWFGLAIAIAFANKSRAKVGHSRPS